MKNQILYAIVDIETTGSFASDNRITEIAIRIHDGEKVIEKFDTLINPEKNIPYFIEVIYFCPSLSFKRFCYVTYFF